MRRCFALLLAVLLLCLTGCSPAPEQDKLSVVAAIFPEYDWARQIIGSSDSVSLRLLVDDGVDPHSFQPTVSDLVTVANCDVLIYGGGESDEWLSDALENANPEMIVVELLPLLGENAHTAEYTEGMTIREEEEELDEHVWLSLRNARLFCSTIADALSKADPAHAEEYKANLQDYLQELDTLDQTYIDTINNAPQNTLLICDRFPFRYLTEDYNLQYYAAFPGCSAESGASFQTIIFLADQLRALECSALLITEGGDDRLARTVADSAERADIPILTLDSMQSVSAQDAKDRSYLQTMTDNLSVLKAALTN